MNDKKTPQLSDDFIDDFKSLHSTKKRVDIKGHLKALEESMHSSSFDEYLDWLNSKIEESQSRIAQIMEMSEAVTLIEHRENLASERGYLAAYSHAKHMYEKLVAGERR